MKKQIKSFLKRHKYIETIVLLIPRLIKKALRKVKEKNFLKKSDGAIFETQNVIKELKNTSFFCFGTLLGIYRDNKIIGRDLDIDVAIIVKDTSDIKKIDSLFTNNGYILKLEFEVEGVGISQQSFVKNGVNVDISYFFAANNELLTYLLYDDDKVLYFSIPMVDSIKKEFNGTEIYIPNYTEKVLERIYGVDWKIPNAKYKYWENPCAIKIPNKGKVVAHELEGE